MRLRKETISAPNAVSDYMIKYLGTDAACICRSALRRSGRADRHRPAAALGGNALRRQSALILRRQVDAGGFNHARPRHSLSPLITPEHIGDGLLRHVSGIGTTRRYWFQHGLGPLFSAQPA